VSKAEATRKAQKLARKLGKGWRICIWENLSSDKYGWHYCAEALDGYLTVWDESIGYHAVYYQWYDEKRFKDPRKAVQHLLVLMKKHRAVSAEQTLSNLVLQVIQAGYGVEV